MNHAVTKGSSGFKFWGGLVDGVDTPGLWTFEGIGLDGDVP